MINPKKGLLLFFLIGIMFLFCLTPFYSSAPYIEINKTESFSDTSTTVQTKPFVQLTTNNNTAAVNSSEYWGTHPSSDYDLLLGTYNSSYVPFIDADKNVNVGVFNFTTSGYIFTSNIEEDTVGRNLTLKTLNGTATTPPSNIIFSSGIGFSNSHKGGDITATTGTGGAAAGAVTGGAGGDWKILTGDGGAAGLGFVSVGGDGGNINLTTGIGGAGNLIVPPFTNGGDGGDIYITAGMGGAKGGGTSVAGLQGDIIFDVLKLQHENGTFDFDDNNLTTTGLIKGDGSLLYNVNTSGSSIYNESYESTYNESYVPFIDADRNVDIGAGNNLTLGSNLVFSGYSNFSIGSLGLSGRMLRIDGESGLGVNGGDIVIQAGDSNTGASGAVYIYNLTADGSLLYNVNATVDASTYNDTYDTWAYNQTYEGSIYNESYITYDNSSYVPYTGATGNVDLGIYNLTAPIRVSSSTGVLMTALNGVLRIVGLKDAFDESILFDFDTTPNVIRIYSDTGAFITFDNITTQYANADYFRGDGSLLYNVNATAAEADTLQTVTDRGANTTIPLNLHGNAGADYYLNIEGGDGATFGGIRFWNETSVGYFLEFAKDSMTGYVKVDDSDDIGNLYLMGQATYINIYNNSNVGIDVAIPTEKLDVGGNVSADYFKGDGSELYNVNASEGSTFNDSYVSFNQSEQNINIGGNNLTGSNSYLGVGTTDLTAQANIQSIDGVDVMYLHSPASNYPLRIYNDNFSASSLFDIWSQNDGSIRMGTNNATAISWFIGGKNNVKWSIASSGSFVSGTGGDTILDIATGGDLYCKNTYNTGKIITGTPTGYSTVVSENMTFYENVSGGGTINTGIESLYFVNKTGLTNVYLGQLNAEYGNVTENLIIGGNKTGNSFYGGMYSFSETGIIGMALNSSYQIINFTNGEHLNGFVFVDDNKLELMDENGVGTYQVNWHTEKDGINNHVYFAMAFVNDEEQNNTIDRSVGQASGAMRMTGNGFISVNNVGDNVTLRIKDISSPSTPAVYIKNINIVRVGA